MDNKLKLDTILKDIDRLVEEKRKIPIIKVVSANNPIEIESIYQKLRYDIEQLNYHGNININKIPVISTKNVMGKIVTIIKRIIRKSTYWLYHPLFTQITKFNAINSSILEKFSIEIDKSFENYVQNLTFNNNELINTMESNSETYKKIFALLNDKHEVTDRLVISNSQSLKELICKYDKTVNELNNFINTYNDNYNNLLCNFKNEVQNNGQLRSEYDQLLSECVQLRSMHEEQRSEFEKQLSEYEQKNIQEIHILKKQVEKYKNDTTILQTKLRMVFQNINKPLVSNEAHLQNAIDLSDPLSEYKNSDWLYYAFEELFRGSEEEIIKRQQQYVPFILKAHNNCGASLVDIGSGRGEFLKLCQNVNITALGVDNNSAMVEHCKDLGLNVLKGDGIAYIKTLPDNSLSAITAFQVIEHLDENKLLELIQTSLLKIKPGGIILLETVNPDCIDAFKNFHFDMSHQKPVFSSVLKFILEMVGFKDVEIHFTSPFDESMKLEGDDKNTQLLNSYLFGYRDYAVVGWK